MMPTDDNWSNRSHDMRCMSCRFFVPKGTSSLGRCRRHAPTLNGFPAVFRTDWCGDHKLDEGAVDQVVQRPEEAVSYQGHGRGLDDVRASQVAR